MTAHRTLRTLAERLASQGCSTLRFDLDGTGDSAGGSSDPDRLAAWRRSVHEASAFLRALGTRSLVLFGVRFGATLALGEGPALGADRVVAWAPVIRGGSYVRELRLLGGTAADGPAGAPDGGLTHAGFTWDADTVAQIRAVDLSRLPAPPAPEVLVIDRDDRPPSNPLIKRIAALGSSVEHRVLSGTCLALDRPSVYADVAEAVVSGVSDWVGHSPPSPTAVPPIALSTRRWDAGAFVDEVTFLGDAALTAVTTEPTRTRRATIVWLNSGSEPHTGPGRAWVLFARSLATSGYASVRLDWSGWGESPGLGHAPGRPYDLHCIQETTSVVRDLRARGHHRIVLAGLCAGSWIALRAALCEPVDGIIAVNPQLYWQTGDPVEADLAETHARRREEIRRFRTLRRTGLWWALDALGVRHPASAWLRELESTGTPVLAVFGNGDDGLVFLDDRVHRAWRRAQRRGSFAVEVIPGLDHSLQRDSLHAAVLEGISTWLAGRTDGDRSR